MTEFRPIAGPAFPFSFDSATGGITVEAGTDKVLDDVQVLLATRLGERVMNRRYGTRLPGLAHDPNDDVLIDIAENQTRQALLQWEPRVVPLALSVENNPDEGHLELRLDLNLPGTSPVVVPLI